MTPPTPTPQGGMYAYYAGPSGPSISGSLVATGRVWVESINSLKGTALVRFDPGEGMRSRAYSVRLTDVDFSREWRIR